MQIHQKKLLIFCTFYCYTVKYIFYHLFRRTEVDAASGTKSGTLKFVRTLTNISKDAGGIAHMRCEVVGDPPPTKIRWYKNEAPLEENRPKITIRKIHAQVRVIVKLLLISNCFSRVLLLFKFNFWSSHLEKLKFYIFYICMHIYIYFIFFLLKKVFILSHFQFLIFNYEFIL